MAEIDQAVLEEIESIAQATEKAELELARKRVDALSPIWEKRREVIAKIPDFWSTVCQIHSGLRQMIEAADIPAIEHLTDIWVKYDPKDVRNYEIVFTFKENPYFTNKELIKKIVVKDDEPVAENFDIAWKNGKDLTLKDQKRKKGADNTTDSFFSWFKDEDVSLADFIVQEVFPEALTIFTQGGDDDGFEDDGSVDLDDDEDDEEEEEEEVEEKHIKKKSKK